MDSDGFLGILLGLLWIFRDFFGFLDSGFLGFSRFYRIL